MTRYRFRVRTPDGQEVVSDIFEAPSAGGDPSNTHEISFTLADDEGKPRAGVRFTLHAGDAVIKGTTGPDGLLTAKIPESAKDATLTLHGEHGDEVHHLALGEGHEEQAPHHIELEMNDDEGKPRAGVKFTFHAGDDTVEGTTGSNGEVKVDLPKHHTEAVLTLHGEHGDEVHQLELG